MSMTYNEIGNIMTKNQVNTAVFDNSPTPVTLADTTYNYNYQYGGAQPHAVTSTGNRTFTYDASGNMITETDSTRNFSRTLSWDSENRLTKTVDTAGSTTYAYDDAGARVIKKGKNGEIVYVNTNYSMRNGETKSKHVFLGTSRLATRMDHNNTNEGIYFYHADHLGSSSVVTSKTGDFHEHIEYFPYGETWVEENKGGINLPYKYTSKELDPETGLYSFGARYYDAKLGRWVSVDPPLVSGEYLPKPQDFDSDHDYLWYLENDKTHELPGLGGVFYPINLNAYHYAGNNPIKFIDPDGKDVTNNSGWTVVVRTGDGEYVLLENGGKYIGKVDAVIHTDGRVQKISEFDHNLAPTVNFTLTSNGDMQFDTRTDKALNDAGDSFKENIIDNIISRKDVIAGVVNAAITPLTGKALPGSPKSEKSGTYYKGDGSQAGGFAVDAEKKFGSPFLWQDRAEAERKASNPDN